jgi:hypothetical protein
MMRNIIKDYQKRQISNPHWKLCDDTKECKIIKCCQLELVPSNVVFVVSRKYSNTILCIVKHSDTKKT